MNETDTLYDRTIRKLKNNKVIVIVLIGFAVLLGLMNLQSELSTVWTAFFPAKTSIKVDVSVERYDFMVGHVGSLKSLKSVQGDITQVRQMAENLARQLTSTIGAAPGKSEVVLSIDGSSLRATQPLRAAVLVFGSPMAQAARVAHELGDANNLDLQPIFADQSFHRPGDRSIDIEVNPPVGSFEREPLTIFKRPDGFSFEADVRAQEKRLTFSPHSARIILSRFEAKGEGLEGASVALESELRGALQNNPSIELSALTLEELEKEKKTIQNLPPGTAKSALANQVNVDYVITGTVRSH